MDEEAERRAFQEAVMEWRKMGKTEDSKASSAAVSNGMWSNPILDESESKQKSNSDQSFQIKSSLADGELDEEKERAV